MNVLEQDEDRRVACQSFEMPNDSIEEFVSTLLRRKRLSRTAEAKQFSEQ